MIVDVLCRILRQSEIKKFPRTRSAPSISEIKKFPRTRSATSIRTQESPGKRSQRGDFQRFVKGPSAPGKPNRQESVIARSDDAVCDKIK